MIAVPHLAPEVVPYLDRTTSERIAFCHSDRWIGYTRARQVLDHLDQLLIIPRGIRMPSLLIVGHANNGKSTILDHYVSRHPILVSETGTPIMPVLKVSMPTTPDEGRFWSVILTELNISHREKDPPTIKRRQAQAAMVYAQNKVLVIDEFNHVVNAGRGVGPLLAAVKALSNDLRLSIVAAGTDAAVHALNSETQMMTRFLPLTLDVWKLGEEYRRFLATYERYLPLPEPSDLAGRELTTKIFGLTGAAIGDTVRLLKMAACQAITQNHSRITASLIDSLEWTPTERYVSPPR